MNSTNISSLPNITVVGVGGNSASAKEPSKMYHKIMEREGKLCDAYAPFQNLTAEQTRQLGDFTTEKLNFDFKHPVDILTQDSYDGSVNLVINDGINTPKLINNRFSVRDDKFLIPDHAGYKDTNIYDEAVFEECTSLKDIPIDIPTVKFLGFNDGAGNMPVGSYTFYFRLTDADDNETEVLAESGIVQCYIGSPSSPSAQRMGLEDENSKKSIEFVLSNIDSAFNYVKVYYARYSSGQDNAMTPLYKEIDYKYPVDINGSCNVTITGNETILPSSAYDIKINYADIASARTQTQYNNSLLQAGTDIPVHDYDLLRRMSWKIIPSIVREEPVGSLDYNYNEVSKASMDPERKWGYYNEKNIYKYTGYWADEIYTFGVVYIFTDNSLSPVFSLQGVDLQKYYKEKSEIAGSKDLSLFRSYFFSDEGIERSYEPESCLFDGKGLPYRMNSRGVIKFPEVSSFKDARTGTYTPIPLGINFDISLIGVDHLEGVEDGTYTIPANSKTPEEMFASQNIKGLFFVRKKRVPTIIGQGIVVDMTDKDRGALPVLNVYNNWVTKSFLQPTRLIGPVGSAVSIRQDAISRTAKAMYMPAARLRQGVYNDIFNGSKYTLKKVAQVELMSDDLEQYTSVYVQRYVNTPDTAQLLAPLVNIQDNTVSKTDGFSYFSSVAGNPGEAYKSKDVQNIWDETPPQDLTLSTSLVRGIWGGYVGIGSTNEDADTAVEANCVYNVKPQRYAEDEDEATALDFQAAFNNHSVFFAICDRVSVKELKNVTCYRGDCFQSVYTHRIMHNFEDPELPTNHTVVNPSCWVENYGVKSTAFLIDKAKMNCQKEDAGWWVDSDAKQDYKKQYLNYLDSVDWKALPDSISKDSLVNDLEELPDDPQQGWDITFTGTEVIYGDARRNITTGESSGSEKLPQQNHYVLTPQEWMFFNFVDPSKPQKFANQIVPAFETYIGKNANMFKERRKVDPKEQESNGGLSLKSVFKNSSNWEIHGISGIIRADVNAVGIGQWLTFPICSNYNLSLRDIEFKNAQEETAHNKKRGFFPLNAKDIYECIPESQAINHASSKSIPAKDYEPEPRSQFIRQEFETRVYSSNVSSTNNITNGYKVTLQTAFADYTKKYGSITKITSLGNYVYVIFKHGIGVAQVNQEFAMGKPMLGPIQILEEDTGSLWKDSILNTGQCIYGVDTVAKKIWRVIGTKVEDLTDFKLKKYLIDHLDMSEFTLTPLVGHVNVKTHYNKYKNDVIFTYYNDTEVKCKISPDDPEFLTQSELFDPEDLRVKPVVKQMEDGPFPENCMRWSLCFNELMNKFITRYDWYPLESENIDNIFFSFDMDQAINLDEETSNQQMGNVSYSIGNPNATPDDFFYQETKEIVDPAFKNKADLYAFSASDFANGVVSDLHSMFDLKCPEFDGEYFNNHTYALSFYAKGSGDLSVKIQDEPHVGFDSYTKVVNLTDGWKFYVLYLGIRTTLENYTTEHAVPFRVTLTPTGALELAEFKVTELETDVANWSSTISRIDGIPFKENATELYMVDSFQELDKDSKDWKRVYSLRNSSNSMKLWKHGQAGIYDCQDPIRPTVWYGKQHEWWIEVSVKPDSPGQQHIYNNLKLLATKEPPYKFEYEVVGETYDWHEIKPIIYWINQKVKDGTFSSLEEGYKEVLTPRADRYAELRLIYSDFPEFYSRRAIPDKIPFLKLIWKDKLGHERDALGRDFEFEDNTVETVLLYDELLNEYSIRTNQIGNDIEKYGRVKGNMHYLEDMWDVEIRPIAFKEASLAGEDLVLSPYKETRPRDKYMKLKIRYTGENLALLFAIYGIINESYA